MRTAGQQAANSGPHPCLLDLLGRSESFERAEELVRRVVSDSSFPDDVRLATDNPDSRCLDCAAGDGIITRPGIAGLLRTYTNPVV
jgi:hypothetical protein